MTILGTLPSSPPRRSSPVPVHEKLLNLFVYVPFCVHLSQQGRHSTINLISTCHRDVLTYLHIWLNGLLASSPVLVHLLCYPLLSRVFLFATGCTCSGLDLENNGMCADQLGSFWVCLSPKELPPFSIEVKFYGALAAVVTPAVV